MVLNTLCSERPFILAILGQSKQHHMVPQRWFLLAFYTWKTLSTFLLIQVLSKQALASLRISSIILCAITMESKKLQALGNDLNFDLKQTSAEHWEKKSHMQIILAFVIFQHIFSLFFLF